MVFRESASRRRFEIMLELPCARVVRKRQVRFDLPRYPFGSVWHISAIVAAKPLPRVIGAAGVKPVRVHFALKDVT